MGEKLVFQKGRKVTPYEPITTTIDPGLQKGPVGGRWPDIGPMMVKMETLAKSDQYPSYIQMSLGGDKFTVLGQYIEVFEGATKSVQVDYASNLAIQKSSLKKLLARKSKDAKKSPISPYMDLPAHISHTMVIPTTPTPHVAIPHIRTSQTFSVRKSILDTCPTRAHYYHPPPQSQQQPSVDTINSIPPHQHQSPRLHPPTRRLSPDPTPLQLLFLFFAVSSVLEPRVLPAALPCGPKWS